MAASRTITVSLAADLVRRIGERVAAGAHAFPSEAVRHGLEGVADRAAAGPSDEWPLPEWVPPSTRVGATPVAF